MEPNFINGADQWETELLELISLEFFRQGFDLLSELDRQLESGGVT